MTLDQLKKYVKTMPDSPGIYKFQDANGHDIYIGKAASLKKRLTSYLRTDDPRIKKMINIAASLTRTETESDIEALILESQLIKQKRPQFNIMLRDDKQYFYVALTNEEFPRLFLTHQPRQKRLGMPLSPVAEGGSRERSEREETDGTGFKGLGKKAYPTADYIGPFTDGMALKITLRFLRNIFPYCTCTQKHHHFCLNYHIGKCIGYCCLKGDQSKIEIEHYQKNIKALRDILSGKKTSLVKQLKKEMESAGKAHNFDRAIELRDKIERLERVFYNARVIKNSEILKEHHSGLQALLKIKNPVTRIEGYDISNIQGEHATGSMVTFINDEPDKNFYRKFTIRTVKGANDPAMLREVIQRRFNHPEWPFPDLIIIDGGKGQVNYALKELKEMKINIPLVGLSKDERHTGKQLIIPDRKRPVSLSKLSEFDRRLILMIDSEAHRFAISHYRHLHGKVFRQR